MREDLGTDHERAANDLAVVRLTLEHLERAAGLAARERGIARAAIGRVGRLAGYVAGCARRERRTKGNTGPDARPSAPAREARSGR